MKKKDLIKILGVKDQVNKQLNFNIKIKDNQLVSLIQQRDAFKKENKEVREIANDLTQKLTKAAEEIKDLKKQNEELSEELKYINNDTLFVKINTLKQELNRCQQRLGTNLTRYYQLEKIYNKHDDKAVSIIGTTNKGNCLVSRSYIQIGSAKVLVKL